VGASLADRRIAAVVGPRVDVTAIASRPGPLFDVPPYRLSGTVYGVLLNHRAALATLGAAVDAAPYKAAPKSVVLYVKPRNTLVAPGGAVQVDAGVAEVEVGAALGIVIGRTTCAVDESAAADCIAGYVIVGDFSVPHASYFRPAIRMRARDASLVVGPRVVARSEVADPDGLRLRVFVDGRLVHETGTGETFRSVARLVADVSEFMTLAPGDLLLAGVAPGAPRVAANALVAIEIDALGRLETRTVAAGASA
jgi:5-oxopent-3-ene-1,2,5-tricarboxylate decarboxylase/2-hydroxyhepta-2,4-diene-1,7-dioate isomerase